MDVMPLLLRLLFCGDRWKISVSSVWLEQPSVSNASAVGELDRCKRTNRSITKRHLEITQSMWEPLHTDNESNYPTQQVLSATVAGKHDILF